MRLVICAAATAILLSRPVIAAESACSGFTNNMGCFDAAPLSGPAEPSPFRWFGRGRVLDFGQAASTAVLRYAASPVELVAPSADPQGRLVPVVRYTTRLDLRLAVGLGRNIDLTLTQPFALQQAGSGPDALLSQSPPALTSSGVGDARLSLRSALPTYGEGFAWSMRLELTLPIGDERAFLGDRSLTEAYAINAHWSAHGLSFVADVGLRVAKPTRFGDVLLGTHALVGLGVDYAPFSRDWVHVSLEALARPNLLPSPENRSTNSDSATGDTKVTHANRVIPADWIASVSSRPFAVDLWFALGAGMALPLSARDGSDARVSSQFVAPTSPRYQVLGSIALRH